jgi:hypothetical protein
MIPTGLLKLKEMLAPGSTMILNLDPVASGNGVPSLPPNSIQGGLKLGRRSLPVRHEGHASIQTRKNVLLHHVL